GAPGQVIGRLHACGERVVPGRKGCGTHRNRREAEGGRRKRPAAFLRPPTSVFRLHSLLIWGRGVADKQHLVPEVGQSAHEGTHVNRTAAVLHQVDAGIGTQVEDFHPSLPWRNRASNCWELRSMAKSASILLRAARASRSRSSALARSSPSASASMPGSWGPTSRPSWPESISS